MIFHEFAHPSVKPAAHETPVAPRKPVAATPPPKSPIAEPVQPPVETVRPLEPSAAPSTQPGSGEARISGDSAIKDANVAAPTLGTKAVSELRSQGAERPTPSVSVEPKVASPVKKRSALVELALARSNRLRAAEKNLGSELATNAVARERLLASQQRFQAVEQQIADAQKLAAIKTSVGDVSKQAAADEIGAIDSQISKLVGSGANGSPERVAALEAQKNAIIDQQIAQQSRKVAQEREAALEKVRAQVARQRAADVDHAHMAAMQAQKQQVAKKQAASTARTTHDEQTTEIKKKTITVKLAQTETFNRETLKSSAVHAQQREVDAAINSIRRSVNARSQKSIDDLHAAKQTVAQESGWFTTVATTASAQVAGRQRAIAVEHDAAVRSAAGGRTSATQHGATQTSPADAVSRYMQGGSVQNTSPVETVRSAESAHSGRNGEIPTLSAHVSDSVPDAYTSIDLERVLAKQASLNSAAA